MERIEATYRIVTPMFIGDANQEATCIRPPSFKGALRFWWRALNWGRFYQQKSSNETEALKALYEEEVRLFGGSAEKGGQGCFLLSVQSKQFNLTKAPKVHDSFSSKAAARYLGYGLMVAYGRNDGTTKNGQLERGCINENQPFTVKLVFRDKIEDSIVVALKALGLLGGLGSRSRHGMGSITLEALKIDDQEPWACPSTVEKYDEVVKGLFLSANGDVKPASVTTEPPFTAFWKKSRIDRLLCKNSCYEVLDKFGEAMLMYRSWGKNGRVLGQHHEKRFEDDHDWYIKFNNGWRDSHSDFHPERVAFGLPHNYHKPPQHHVTPENHERRSSPLFFHIHRLSSGSFLGVSIYMPAKFLPSGEKIAAGGKMVRGDYIPTLVPSTVNKGKMGDVIVNFLDGKVGNPATKEDRFPKPDKKAVLP